MITMRGRDFGVSLDDIRVFVGPRESPVESLRVYWGYGEGTTELRARVPTGSGLALPVVVEVAGQVGLSLSLSLSLPSPLTSPEAL